MSNPDDLRTIPQVTRVLQIIVGAMVSGLIVFLVFTAVLNFNQRHVLKNPDRIPIFTYAAIPFAVMALIASVLIPRLMVTTGRRRFAQDLGTLTGQEAVDTSAGPPRQTREAREFFPLFYTKTIIAAAIVEGAAFFAIVAYFLEGSPLALTLALVLILAVAVQFPTRSRVEQWVENQLQLTDQERQFIG